MTGRVELIQAVLSCYELPAYLEIGFGDGWCFNQITTHDKTCVDPHPHKSDTWGTQGNCITKTSTDFFKNNTRKYDVIFIDGDHAYDAVCSDFENSANCLNPNGTIILHDCNPMNEWMCRPKAQFFPERGEPWNGDGGYRLLMRLYQTSSKYTWMTSNEDHGCCVLRFGKRVPVMLGSMMVEDSYIMFDRNRKDILNLMPIDKIIEKCCGNAHD